MTETLFSGRPEYRPVLDLHSRRVTRKTSEHLAVVNPSGGNYLENK